MEHDRETQSPLRPLIFGEVLYDCFPDGSVVLGGAPFNVAWHLQGFGLSPMFVSRVGADELGERVLADMVAWGMDCSGVQRDPTHPTGRVVVSIQDNEPSFEIVPEQAYDFIDTTAVEKLLRENHYGLAYHGSLIARHPTARSALDTLRANDIPIFIDVNLRDPWWENDWLQQAMKGARWGKLNERELRMLARGEDASELELKSLAETLRKDCGLDVLVVTCGAAGAVVLTAGEVVETASGPVKNLVDTVGAGDSFSAVTIMGMLQGWPLEVVAQRAVDFASAVCGMRGATGHDHELYEHYQQKWAS